jgi:membrane protease subunit HflK
MERVNEAQGDVAKFVAIQKEYARAPEVTRSRLYLETMTEVLPKAGKKVFMDKELKGVMPLLFPADGSGAKAGGAR